MIAAPLAAHKTDIALKIHMVEGGRSDIKEYKTFSPEVESLEALYMT